MKSAEGKIIKLPLLSLYAGVVGIFLALACSNGAGDPTGSSNDSGDGDGDGDGENSSDDANAGGSKGDDNEGGSSGDGDGDGGNGGSSQGGNDGGTGGFLGGSTGDDGSGGSSEDGDGGSKATGGDGSGGSKSIVGKWDEARDLRCGDEAGIASDGKFVHVVTRCGGNLNYLRSTDQGATWEDPVILADNIAIYLQDPIATLGEDVFIVYFRVTDTVFDFLQPRVSAVRDVGNLYYLRSQDGGKTWSDEKALTTGAQGFRMGMDVDPAGLVHISFMNYRPGDFPPDGEFGTWDVRYLRGELGSDDEITWSDQVLQSGLESFGYERPAIKALGDDVHIVWMHPRASLGDCAANDAGVVIPSCPGVGYLRSTDGGKTWPPAAVELTEEYSLYASRPSIAVIPPTTLVVAFDVFKDEPDNYGLDAFTAASNDGGKTWAKAQALTDSSGDSTHGFAGSHEQTTWVVWHDTVSGSLQAHLRESFDGGKTWCDMEQVSSASGSNTPLVGGSDDYLHVVWLREGGDVQYRRRSLANTCR